MLNWFHQSFNIEVFIKYKHFKRNIYIYISEGHCDIYSFPSLLVWSHLQTLNSSSSCLTNWTKPQEVPSYRLEKEVFTILFHPTHLCCLSSLTIDTLRVFCQVCLGAMIYIVVNDDLKITDDKFTLLPPHPVTLLLSAWERRAIWWPDIFESFNW